MSHRLFTSAVFCAVSLLLSAGVYLWRRHELSSLRGQLEAPHYAGLVPRDSLSPVPGKFDAAELIRSLKEDLDDTPDSPESARGCEGWENLSASQISALSEAALAGTLTDKVKQRIAGLLAEASAKLPEREAVPVLLEFTRMQKEFSNLLQHRINEWIMSDPSAAVSWLTPHLADGSLAHFSEDARHRFSKMAEFGGMLADPLANLERMRQAGKGMQGSLLQYGMRRLKTAKDRRTLAAAAFTWPDTGSVQQVLPAVLTSLAAESGGFEGTVAWLQGLHDVSSARRAEVLAVLAIGQPGNPDTGRNADAILQQVNEPVRAEFAGKLVSQWLSQDHRAAAEWINAHPGAAWQDQARQAFARGITTSEPADAMTWAFSISEPGLRTETAMHVFTQWKSKDAAAAGAFLTGSSVPDDLKESLER